VLKGLGFKSYVCQFVCYFNCGIFIICLRSGLCELSSFFFLSKFLFGMNVTLAISGQLGRLGKLCQNSILMIIMLSKYPFSFYGH